MNFADSKLSCASCGAQIAANTDKKLIPFCSSRCKLVDLGKWFKEEYTIPTNDIPDEFDDVDLDDNLGESEH